MSSLLTGLVLLTSVGGPAANWSWRGNLAQVDAEKPSRQVDDMELAKQVSARLIAAKKRGEISGFNLELQIDKGVVVLKGHVSKPGHIQVIVSALQGVLDQVQGFELQLKIKGKKPSVQPEQEERLRPLLHSDDGDWIFFR